MSEHEQGESMRTTIEVSTDGWTGRQQLAIYRGDLGTRLAGPKFNGSSKPVATFEVTPSMARDLIAECQRVIAQGADR